MKKFLLIAFAFSAGAIVCAQDATPTGSTPAVSASASPADVEALRQQVATLTEMVKTLQQQVKDQQAAIEKVNPAAAALPQNPEPAASAPPLFPTTDSGVVAAAPGAPPASPGVNAN